MVLDPEAAARVFGYVSKPVPRVLIEGCGYIALSSSLTISLLVLELAMAERSADSDDTTTPTTMKGSTVTTTHRAVGLGLLLRQYWLIQSYATGTFLKAGLQPQLVWNVGLFCFLPLCILSLLIGTNDTGETGETTLLMDPQRAGALIMATLIALSAYILFCPESAARWLFHADLSRSDMVLDRGVFRGFGQGNLINSTLLSFLVHGTGLHRSLGYTCLVWGCISLYGGFISTMHKDLGISRRRFVIQTVTAGIFAMVMLLQS